MGASEVLPKVRHGNYEAMAGTQPELKVLMDKRPFQWWVSLQPREEMGSPRTNMRVEARGGPSPASWGTPTSKITGSLTPVCLPPGCPEEPANLESFGGEDPRPELYLSWGSSLPSPCLCPPACLGAGPGFGVLWGVGEGQELC